MKMFSFSRPNKRPVGFMTCLKSWLCVDISRYDTSHIHSETVDTTNWINKFPQTLNRNWSSFVHRLLWLHQNQTEDLLVACNEIVSSYFYDLFSHNITFAIFFNYIACTIKVLKYEKIGGKSNFKKFIFIIFFHFTCFYWLLISNHIIIYHHM